MPMTSKNARESVSAYLATTLVLTALFIWPLTASARDCLSGTWQGTIGAVPVMIEFDEDGPDNARTGSYYYRNSLDDLLLLKEMVNPSRWKELDSKEQVTGYLTIACNGASLNGTWQSPAHSKSQKLVAVRAQQVSYGQARLRAIKPIVLASKSIGKHQYQQLKFKGQDTVAGIRLIGNTPGLDKINAAQNQQFIDAVDNDLRCRLSGRLRMGKDHGYEHEAEWDVIAWNDAFIVISKKTAGYCGGAHPYFGKDATIYDVKTGVQEAMSSWLAKEFQENISIDSGLGEIILKTYRTMQGAGFQDCADSIQISDSNIWPTSSGMVFQMWAPYALSGCIADVVVPYKKIAPYLSPRGKSAVQNFLNRKPAI